MAYSAQQSLLLKKWNLVWVGERGLFGLHFLSSKSFIIEVRRKDGQVAKAQVPQGPKRKISMCVVAGSAGQALTAPLDWTTFSKKCSGSWLPDAGSQVAMP